MDQCRFPDPPLTASLPGREENPSLRQSSSGPSDPLEQLGEGAELVQPRPLAMTPIFLLAMRVNGAPSYRVSDQRRWSSAAAIGSNNAKPRTVSTISVKSVDHPEVPGIFEIKWSRTQRSNLMASSSSRPIVSVTSGPIDRTAPNDTDAGSATPAFRRR